MNGSADPPQTLGHPAPKLRLLLAEDEASLRQLFCDLLGAEYEVIVAVDGERAWELAQAGNFDLVLSDIEMPGLNGIELTRRLRTQAHTADIPILLLSANNKPAVVVQALEADADDFLLKPFRPQELLTRIRHRLRLHRRRQPSHAANPTG